MQPFAQKPQNGLQLHWWITAGIAGAFFIWCFDLIPQFRSGHGGKVAGNANPSSSLLDSDWSDISVAQASSEKPSSQRSESDEDDWLEDEDSVADLSELSEPATPDSSTEPRGQIARAKGAHRRVSQASFEEDSSPSAIVRADYNGGAAKPGRQEDSVLPGEYADALHTAEQLLDDGEILDAHAALSGLYWKYPAHREIILETIQTTARQIFISREHQFGEPHVVEYGETLETIGREYNVPWQYLATLNQVTPKKLQAGQQLKVVRGPFGAVVDLKSFTLTIHAHGWYVNHYRIGTGADDKTPVGEFKVQEKLENPTWYNPDGGVVEADDPANPLGEYWIGLGDHIGIHGTIDPTSIGRRASRGCIHLGDEDIQEVFNLLGEDSVVRIRR